MKLVICDFNRTLYDPTTERLHPGALETLQYFRQHGAKVVILSTESAGRAALLERLGLTEYCEEIRFVHEKTKAVVLTLVDQYAVQPNEALLIGDDPEGELLIGRRLHLPTVAVGTGYCSPEIAMRMELPFYLSINDLTEMKL